MQRRIFFVVTLFLMVVAAVYVNASVISEDDEGLQVGDLAPDFSLEGTDGRTISMSDFKDAKGFIVVFTCNTCPYAKLYEDRVIALDKKYSEKGFPVIAINPNDVSQKSEDDMASMITRAQEKNYTFPYLRDDSQETTKAYGASKTPHVYVLNKESGDALRVEYIGAIDDSPRDEADVQEKYVEQAIDALLAGKKPSVKEVRAIGCTIKWKAS